MLLLWYRCSLGGHRKIPKFNIFSLNEICGIPDFIILGRNFWVGGGNFKLKVKEVVFMHHSTRGIFRSQTPIMPPSV